MLKICYLVNQYPKVSHTFIRRELLALEKLGVEVLRVSARRVSEVLVDPIDIEELNKTHFLVSGNKKKLITDALLEFFTNFPKFVSAAKTAYLLGKKSGAMVSSFIYLIEACSVKRICVSNAVDHLHAHFGTNPASMALLSKKLGGPSYSFTVHGPDEFDNPVGHSLGTKIGNSKFTVAITSFCKSQLFRWCTYPDWTKVVEVHCAVDDTLLSKPSTEISAPNQLVNIGRLSEQKGQMLLLESMSMLHKKGVDVQLSIVGDGDLRSTMEAYVAQEGLSEVVNFLGWQSTEQIVDLLDKSTALVLPSFAEGLPVVIMESFARARPVVTTRIAGIPELVDEECGLLISAGSVPSLNLAIEKLVNTDLATLNKMGQEGKRRVRERHDSMREAEILLEYCQKTDL